MGEKYVPALREQVLEAAADLLGPLSNPDYHLMNRKVQSGGLYGKVREALARFGAVDIGDEDSFTSYAYALEDAPGGLSHVIYLSYIAEYACLTSFRERYQDIRLVTSLAECRSAQEEALCALFAANGVRLLPQSLLDEPVPAIKGLFRIVEPGEETVFTLLFEDGYPLWKLYIHL